MSVNRIAVVVAVLAGALGVTAILWLKSPESAAGEHLVVGTVDEIKSQGVMYVPDPGLYVVATEDGFLALWDDARHVGDRVLYCSIDETFSSAHGERFDQQGRYIAGPAAGDLGIYPVEIQDSMVVVDLSEGPQRPERSSIDRVIGEPSQCQGAEDPPGFFENGVPNP